MRAPVTLDLHLPSFDYPGVVFCAPTPAGAQRKLEAARRAVNG